MARDSISTTTEQKFEHMAKSQSVIIMLRSSSSPIHYESALTLSGSLLEAQSSASAQATPDLIREAEIFTRAARLALCDTNVGNSTTSLIFDANPALNSHFPSVSPRPSACRNFVTSGLSSEQIKPPISHT